MSFSERQIHNLFEIAKIVYASPEPNELCALLATRVCPEGELAKVYLAKLDQDGLFKGLASFGYARESKIQKYKMGIRGRVDLRAEDTLLRVSR